MKRFFVLTAALLVLGAGIATAAPPGVNLAYNSCVGPSDRLFACDDNNQTMTLIGSFVIPYDIPDFVAVSAAVDCEVAAGVVPPWFEFGPGGCRDGSMSLFSVGALAGCQNPYLGGNQGGGFLIQPLGPNKFRVRLDWARDNAGAVLNGVHYSGFVLAFNTALSWDELGLVVPCAGCNVPACFVLNAVELYSASGGRSAILEQPDQRNWVTWQGGTASCPGATPSRNATWGSVKATYR